MKQQRKKYVLAMGIFLAIAVLAIGALNQGGYVLDGPYIVKGGTLKIESALPGSEVFIDNRRRGKITDPAAPHVIRGVTSGTHTIIIAHTEAWPWIREFESKTATEHVIMPLQIPQNVGGSIVPEDDPAYEEAVALISEYREPTRATPLEWLDAKLWVVGTTVQTQRGDEVFNTLRSQYPVRNVAWYQDRTDVVLVAASDSIFAIDLEEREPQNFQPIYSGIEPAFAVNPSDSNELYIQDGGHMFRVSLK